MKDLLSKEHYCYKIHTSLMKTSAYLLFYRQPPLATPPLDGYMGYPPFLQRILIPLWKIFHKNRNCHISKEWGGESLTMNITYLLKQSYNGEMGEGYI